MVATPETDAELAEREREKGRRAREAGRPRTDNPWSGGLCERWWFEGYDGTAPIVGYPL